MKNLEESEASQSNPQGKEPSNIQQFEKYYEKLKKDRINYEYLTEFLQAYIRLRKRKSSVQIGSISEDCSNPNLVEGLKSQAGYMTGGDTAAKADRSQQAYREQ